jgi:(1->4)-alpha-D-glucan 1-alpha-D-glucosylmutase
VDPDNRRDIDFELRTRMHAELEARAARGEDLLPELLSSWEDGRVKLWLTRIALRFRAAHQALFLEGEYLPLEARGRSEHVCAFARRWHGEWALVVVPRLVSRLPMEQSLPLGAEVWRDSALLLPGGAPLRWTNVLTHQPSFASALENELRLEELLLRFPVALLHATE